MPNEPWIDYTGDVDSRVSSPLTPHLYGAVDIGGTKILAGLLTDDGRIVASSEFPTEPERGPENAISQVIGALSSNGATMGHLKAVGIGCTGPVDPLTGVVGDVALLPGWNGFPLAPKIAERFEVPVCLENDCDAAALGEASEGDSRFLYVSISTGIGAGFIIDGEIYRGLDGAHPELGHHSIDQSGPLCYCGAHGCWESLASGTAIASLYGERLGRPGEWTAAEIFRKASEGEALAIEAVEHFTFYLGVGLANLITLFAPNTIALGGGVMASAPVFFEQAITLARSRAGLVPSSRIQIRTATLGRFAGLVGAARAAHLHSKQLSKDNLCTPV